MRKKVEFNNVDDRSYKEILEQFRIKYFVIGYEFSLKKEILIIYYNERTEK